MKASFLLAAALLPGWLHAAPSDLRGVLTDLAGRPLRGATVSVNSTGASTTTNSDGSWILSRSVGLVGRNPSPRAVAREAFLENGRLRVRRNGHLLDGRFGGGTDLPSNPSLALARAATTLDTLCYGWAGVMFCQILSTVETGDLGAERLDTAGWGRFELRALRFDAMGLRGLGLSLANVDATTWDSLTIRLHMDGTPAEMADFAARVDLGALYDAAGFITPVAGFPNDRIVKIRPSPVNGGCAGDRICSWTFDLPLAGLTLAPQARLSLLILFDSHFLSGDTTELANRAATHDPFAGADWSFRPHGSNHSEARYSGTPALPTSTFDSRPRDVPIAPFISVMRKGSSLYGTAP